MSDQRTTALRTIVLLVSQVLWVVGMVIGLSGFYLLMKYKQNNLFFSDSYITLTTTLTLVTAVFLFVSGCFGSWLSYKESIFLQGLFVYLLVVIFCLQSTASALAYFHTIKLDSEITPITGVFQNYTGSSQDPNSRAVDVTQEELQCCGVHDYRDWLETSWFNQTGGLQVPHSCCNTTFPSCNGTVNQPWQLYKQGCHVKLEMTLHFVLRLIIWGFPLVLLVEVVLVLTVAQLMTRKPHVNHKYEVLN